MKTESQFRSFCLHVASLPFWSKLHGNLPSKLSKSKAKRWQWYAYWPRAPGYPYTCPRSCNHYGIMNKKIVRQKNFEIILFYSALFYQNQTMSLFHSDFSGIPFNCLGGRGLQCAFSGQCQQLFWGGLLGAVALQPWAGTILRFNPHSRVLRQDQAEATLCKWHLNAIPQIRVKVTFTFQWKQPWDGCDSFLLKE